MCGPGYIFPKAAAAFPADVSHMEQRLASLRVERAARIQRDQDEYAALPLKVKTEEETLANTELKNVVKTEVETEMQTVFPAVASKSKLPVAPVSPAVVSKSAVKSSGTKLKRVGTELAKPPAKTRCSEPSSSSAAVKPEAKAMPKTRVSESSTEVKPEVKAKPSSSSRSKPKMRGTALAATLCPTAKTAGLGLFISLGILRLKVFRIFLRYLFGLRKPWRVFNILANS